MHGDIINSISLHCANLNKQNAKTNQSKKQASRVFSKERSWAARLFLSDPCTQRIEALCLLSLYLSFCGMTFNTEITVTQHLNFPHL